MGKKSRRNNKNDNNNKGPLRNEQELQTAEATPSAPALLTRDTSTILFHQVARFTDDQNSDEIRKLESKYRHIDTYSNEPFEAIHILVSFGIAYQEGDKSEENGNYRDLAIHYFERALEAMHLIKDDRFQVEIRSSKLNLMTNCLALTYANGRDTEKTISTHRWALANCNRDELDPEYLIQLFTKFMKYKEYNYAIEVLEDFVDRPPETFKEQVIFFYRSRLIETYMECNEFLKARALLGKIQSTCTDVLKFEEASIETIDSDLSTSWKVGNVELALCNYRAAIKHCRNTSDICKSLGSFSPVFGKALLRHSAKNETEAFGAFQAALGVFQEPSDVREEILFEMAVGYRILEKWSQSIHTLRQLFFSVSHTKSTMLLKANIATTKTYLEQYCIDTALDINQRAEILHHATEYSQKVNQVSTEMYLIHAQLFYFNGDKHHAYRHLESYLDGHLAECKLKCYTCQQRVREGSVSFSCESCLVASYCDRRHQKLTWKKDRICHRVLCPLLGYWRKTKKKRKGRANEDRHEKERVFEMFFGSIGPHV